MAKNTTNPELNAESTDEERAAHATQIAAEMGAADPASRPIPEEVIPEPTIDEEPKVEVPKMADLEGIRYTGRADVREISAHDLALQGVDGPKGDLRFSAENNWFVPASEINAATRDWFATQTDEFVVV